MKSILTSLAVAILLPATLFAQDVGKAKLPPAAESVDFHKQIVPILYRSCIKCHSGEKAKGGLRMETRALLLAGGDSGEVVVPGKSGESLLIELVAGLDKDRIMPGQGPRLGAEQIGLLRRWIDDGLKWEEGFTFVASHQAPLAPRRVKLPAVAKGSKLTNPIDRLLQPYFVKHKVSPGKLVSDRVFARRVYLDVIGLLPPPAELDVFEKNTAADKRARLVDKLLANRREYAVHWLTFWNDALRNAYRGTGYIDGGRKQITPWLYKSLHENKPYDRFVHELISPVPGSEGFIRGIIWRGVVNASQRREMQAAQNVTQVLMGTNLKCASCHDSFINQWKLTDSYGLAAVFADGPLEIHRCNKPIGKIAEVHFIYPELGSIDPKAPKATRMKQLADAITSKKNGRLSRTMVNRLWAHFFGRGIVEPVDDMDRPPLSEDLLDWLAADLADHKYDLKHTMRLICTSRAYQLTSVGAPKPDASEFVFRGPLVRRMSAEAFVDAVATLTGSWPGGAAAKLPALDDAATAKTHRVRTALVNDDVLTRALGRPNREQIVTRRDTITTTIQALELTNGATLDGMLKRGARTWLGRSGKDSKKLVDQLFQTAIGRRPRPEEHAAATELVGRPATVEGIEDLLWVLTMLPEFQLVY
jgi:hypothetical protein